MKKMYAAKKVLCTKGAARKMCITAVMITALLLVSGVPAFIVTLTTTGHARVSIPQTSFATTGETVLKHIMLTPAVIFFYAVGLIGLLGLRQTHNPNYAKFAPLCYIFICGSYGLIILLFKFTLT